jgi:tetratricopeptide (TPR) repeat protein
MTQPQPKYAEAEAFLTPLLEEQRAKLGTTSHASRNTAIQLANLYFKQSRHQEAEVLLTPLVTDDLVTQVMKGGRKALDQNPALYNSLDILAQIQRKKGNSAQADALTLKLRQLLEVGVKSALNSVPGGQNLESPLLTTASLAMQYLNADRYTEAEDTFNTVLEGYRQVAGNRPGVQIASLLSSAAGQYTTKGMDVQAEKLLTALVDIHQHTLGDGDPLTHTATGVLAQWHQERRRYTVAQEMFVHLLQIQSNSIGSSHINTRGTMNALALAYLAEAKSLQAEGKPELVRRVYEKLADIQARHLAIFRNELADLESSNARITMNNLAHSYGVLGKYSEAEQLFTQLLAIQRNTAGIQPLPMLEVTAALGWAQFHQRKYAEAEMNLRAALRGSEQISLDNWERHNFESMLGAVLVAQKKFADAERHLLASHEKMLQRQTRSNFTGFISEAVPGERILRLYQEWGNPEQAAVWKKKLLATTSRVEPGK